MRRAALLAIATCASIGAARADSTEAPEPPRVVVKPIGAVGGGGELTFGDGPPRQRFAASATVFVGRRLGLRVGLARTTLALDRGEVTAGVAYRAAAARPRLELVLHGGVGVAWPSAPAATAGVTTYLWPTKLPIAVTTGLQVHAIVDGLDTGPALSLGLGLALAR